jgi:AraC-like DNA-binding protein
MRGAAKLPASVFSTAAYGQPDQFDAWRENISVLFDVTPPARAERRAPVRASIRAYHLGGMILAKADFDRQGFARNRKMIESGGLDHYLVQLYDSGGLEGSADDRKLVLRRGDVQILDLSQPLDTANSTSNTVALVIPRDSPHKAIGSFPLANLHGLVVRGNTGLGGLLGDHLRSFATRIDQFTIGEGPAASRSLLNMVAACFNPSIENAGRARAQVAEILVERLNRYIDMNLGSPRLSVPTICAQFGISRAQLYRVFEPLGGVAKYVQDRRLARVHAELRSAGSRHLQISEIARAAGFASDTHFSRAFHCAFGSTPREVRASNLRMDTRDFVTTGASSGFEYRTWIKDL